VVKLIEASEGRSRSRTANEQLRFNHAVHVLLTDWTCHSFVPVPCSVFMQLFVQKPVGFSNLMLSGDELDCKTH
jgi:hypothetical protein